MGKIIFRNKWLEISKGFNFAFKFLTDLEDPFLCISLIYFTFYISIPRTKCFSKYTHTAALGEKTYGIYWHERCLWLCWGNRVHCVRSPWDYQFISRKILYPDGWRSGDHWNIKDGRIVNTYKYHYHLENGRIQNTEATIYMEKMEWCWNWFRMFRYPRMVRTAINVQFADHIGAKGVLGCTWDIKEGETPLQALRRMEETRTFD